MFCQIYPLGYHMFWCYCKWFLIFVSICSLPILEIHLIFYIALACCHFANLAYSATIFVDFLGFSTLKLMISVCKDNLIFSFPICMLLPLFLAFLHRLRLQIWCWIVVRGNIPYFVRGKVFCPSPFSVMLSCVFCKWLLEA